MRQVPLSPLSFDPQRVANVPEHPPPSTRLRSCAHIANRRLSRIIGASTVNPASTQPGLSQSKRVGDWTLSLDYVEGADQVKGRIAGTDELSKRGQPLMLLGCSEGRLNTSETRSSLKMLYFVDGPEDGFWQGEPLTRGGTRLGWIRFKSAEDDEYPRL